MTRPTQPLRRDEIRRNADGTLDEVVVFGCDVHLEQMDRDHWWLGIAKGGQVMHVNFHGVFSRRGGVVQADVQDDGIGALEVNT